MTIIKKCIGECKLEKSIYDFYIGRNECKECIKKNSKNYRKNNLEIIKQKDKDRRIRNKKPAKIKIIKEYIKAKSVQEFEQKVKYKICKQCKENKDISLFNIRKYRSNMIGYMPKCIICIDNNKKMKKIKRIERYKNNKEKELLNDNIYRKNNKEKINIRRNKNIQNRTKNDISFRLKHNISSCIRGALIRNNSSKRKLSFICFIGYTIEELKNHIEKLFEPWMTWENWGIYNSKIWNNNDSKTWKWQIDHIIPCSRFKYVSMEDEQFKKCWALENLRPYSAKLNIIESDRRGIV